MLIEKYERFIEMMKGHNDEYQGELFGLGSKDLTEDDRVYQNSLMDSIGYANTQISMAERKLKRLKENRDA